jgi:hypothetical protein
MEKCEMQVALATVRYCLKGNAIGFWAGIESAAAVVAETPGLMWKVWAVDEDRSGGISAYLFQTIDAAHTFVKGPVIDGLRRHPDISDVSVHVAPVNRDLSRKTGAGHVLTVPAVGTDHPALATAVFP